MRPYVARYRDGPTFAAPLSIVLRRLGVVGGRGEGTELCHAPLPLARTSRCRARGGRHDPRACDFVEAPELAGCHREFEVDRNPANINHRLCLHGRHSEDARADRRRYRPSNLSVCFHPHFAGVTIAGHFVTVYRRPRALRFPATRVSARIAGATIAGRLLQPTNTRRVNSFVGRPRTNHCGPNANYLNSTTRD